MTRQRVRSPHAEHKESTMNDAMIAALIERRMQLRARGYMPIPLHGKIPPMKEWQKLTAISPTMLKLWSESWRDATNTGLLTRYAPVLDIDIYNEPAAIAIEEFVSSRFEDSGTILVRIGMPPKRAIPFRTDAPFKKITVNLVAPKPTEGEKIELLCDGQQLAIDGIHPDTKQPYRWHGGVPWDVARTELPCLNEQEARQLVDDVVGILIADFNYRRAAPAPSSNGGRAGGEEGWKHHLDNIRHGRSLHDSITRVAAALIKSGMHRGVAVHLLQALVELSDASHDERWEARFRDIPRAIDTARQKYSKR
jgi:Bifunctional DNA primase/polymerase, N-terminal